MKPRSKQLAQRYMQMHLVYFLIMIIVIALSFLNASAQIVDRPDPLFPARRSFNAGLITTYTSKTPPPALIADLTYGFSKKFSLGIVGGTTGALALTGIKLNAILLGKDNFRMVYRMTSVYYFRRNGTFLFDKSHKQVMPWILTMGAVDAEWTSKNGTRWAAGMGFLETHCVEGMMEYLFNEEAEIKSPFEVFHTIQGSVSIPVTNKFIIRPEVITVLRGNSFIKPNVFKVDPYNVFLNLVYTF